MKIKTIKLANIEIGENTQQRTEITQQVVADYTEAMKCGAKFPPITVFGDGVNYYLADGFHRYFSMKACDFIDVEAEVHDGSARDARWYSLGANGKHGLRLTNADKRKAVLIALMDREWQTLTDVDIAKQCHVSAPFVGKLRVEIATDTKYDSKTVSSSYKKPKENKNKRDAKFADPPPTVIPDEYKEDAEYGKIDELTDTVADLQEMLAVQNYEATDEEKVEARKIIEAQRAEIKQLTESLRVVKIARDTYQNENAQLRKQITMQRREIDKLTGKRTA